MPHEEDGPCDRAYHRVEHERAVPEEHREPADYDAGDRQHEEMDR